MATTLVDLIKNDHPSRDVLETFRDYAESGAAISPHGVKAILDKSSLTREELDTAYQHMQTGMTRQITAGQGVAGLEYFQAMNYLAQMIASTIPMGETQGVPSSDPLVVLKSQLIKAHNHKHKGSLEHAVRVFQQYCLTVNPDEFGKGESTINLTPHAEFSPGIYTKAYNLARYGGLIPIHDYLMGVHATDDFQIAEAPAKR